MTYQQHYERLSPLLEEHQLDEAIELCERGLRAIPETDYHKVLNVQLNEVNPSFAEWINDFHARVNARMPVRSIYAELNGFTINPDLWFVDLFAFDNYHGLAHLDWTGDWQDGNATADESFGIEGFEQVQEQFTRDLDAQSERTQQEGEARTFCEFLVVLRVQQLFQRTVERLETNCPWKHIPFIVTAHDWELVYETKA